MGNSLIFTTRDKYAMVEGGVGATLLIVTAFIAAVFFIRFLCCCYGWNGSRKIPARKGDFCCPEINKKCVSVETLHDILGTVFENIKELKVWKTGNEIDDSKLLVISDRKVPSSCNGCLAYTYYTYMMFMSAMWFLATAVDLIVYRKTTTCNDINVDDNSFICFNVDDGFKTIDCEITPDIQQKKVICYLFNPSIAGIGVAFSIAKLICVLADIVYKINLWLTNNYHRSAIILRIILILLALVLLSVYVALTLTKKVSKTYFIFGHVPMRIAQLVLLCLTVGGLLVIPPWSEYTDEDYKKYYDVGYNGDVENNSNNDGYRRFEDH